LGNYALMLARVGRDDEALAAAEEGATPRREPAGTHPAGLASALQRYGARLIEVGRTDDARAAQEESVRLYRAFEPRLIFELLPGNRAAMTPRYAQLLYAQAVRLDRAGRAADSVQVGAEAVAAAREAMNGNRAGRLTVLAVALHRQAE
jgi:hypothetical protein